MEIFIIIGLILLNGILSMSEIALVSARKARLELDAKRGNKSAQTALKLAGEPDRFLSTIQIGITLIGILTGLYSGEAFAYNLAEVVRHVPVLEPYALGVSKTIIVIIVTYLILIMGELVPKRIGMGYAERVSMLVAKPMYFLSKLALPFVWLLSKSTSLVIKITGIKANEENKVTEEEIKAIVKEGFDGGEVQEVEQDIVERVFNLGDRNVGSIMTHRSDLVWLDVTDSIEKIREKVQENLFNIYPVASEKFDNIKGVVYLKDLFGRIDEPDFSLEEVILAFQMLPGETEDTCVFTLRALESDGDSANTLLDTALTLTLDPDDKQVYAAELNVQSEDFTLYFAMDSSAVTTEDSLPGYRRSEERRVGKECRSRWSPYH